MPSDSARRIYPAFISLREGRVALVSACGSTYIGCAQCEGHGLREPAHQLDKMRREMAWIEKYVRGE